MKIVTVKDLINELKKYPLDLRIFDYMFDPIEEIRYEKEIPLGDPANPKCKYTEGVIIE